MASKTGRQIIRSVYDSRPTKLLQINVSIFPSPYLTKDSLLQRTKAKRPPCLKREAKEEVVQCSLTSSRSKVLTISFSCIKVNQKILSKSMIMGKREIEKITSMRALLFMIYHLFIRKPEFIMGAKINL